MRTRENAVDIRQRFSKTAAAMVSTVALLGCFVSRAGAQPRWGNGLVDQCGKYLLNPSYKNHEFEVCTAYTIDAAGYQELGVEFGGLTPYYGFGNSPSSVKRDLVRHHFETRYWLSARNQIEARVGNWQPGDNLVDNSIVVRGLVASLPANRAIVRTTESWRVEDGDANIVYQEKNKDHNSTMCRIKERGFPHFLHEWVVVANTAQPRFKCNKFSAEVAAGKIS